MKDLQELGDRYHDAVPQPEHRDGELVSTDEVISRGPSDAEDAGRGRDIGAQA
jgi:hypothetical protein